jgi:hypothetical protein
MRRNGPGDGNPLLLAAGQLKRPMLHPPGWAHQNQDIFCPLLSLASAPEPPGSQGKKGQNRGQCTHRSLSRLPVPAYSAARAASSLTSSPARVAPCPP